MTDPEPAPGATQGDRPSGVPSPSAAPPAPAPGPDGPLLLGPDTVDLLRVRLPQLAESTVRAIIDQVPAYTDALAGPIGANIRSAVELALGGFLTLATRPAGAATRSPRTPALDGAYALGRGEARSGRSMEALLAAYRIGARESWRQFSRTAVETGVGADAMARFAELVFAYIDELSAASAAGHTDELATTGRVRERYLARLVTALLKGVPADQAGEAADRAGWKPSATLAAVVLPTGQAARALTTLDDRTLRTDEPPALPPEEQSDLTVLLVPDADGPGRTAVTAALLGLDACLGPAVGWADVHISYRRALRARRLLPTPAPAGAAPDGGTDAPVARRAPRAGRLIDTEEHLVELVVSADPDALADLRRRALAPLADLRPGTAERLVETLRAWLLLRGRRDEVAALLHVHPQTVRYRVGQLRELWGDRLDDPQAVAELVVALAQDTTPAASPPPAPPTPATR